MREETIRKCEEMEEQILARKRAEDAIAMVSLLIVILILLYILFIIICQNQGTYKLSGGTRKNFGETTSLC